MPYPATWTALVAAVNADVVARLAAAGYPALNLGIDGSPGQIEMGPAFQAENHSPPYVVFVPKTSPIEGPTRFVTGRAGMSDQERKAMLSRRAIARMWKTWIVFCWGCNFSDQTTPAPDPALDFDAAQALAEIVFQSCQGIAADAWKPGAAIEIDQTSLVRIGRVFTFDLALDTPVLDTAQAFAVGVAAGPGKVDVVVGGQTVQGYP